jgi:hypothetical protein
MVVQVPDREKFTPVLEALTVKLDVKSAALTTVTVCGELAVPIS